MSKMASKLEGLRHNFDYQKLFCNTVENGFQIGRVTTKYLVLLFFPQWIVENGFQIGRVTTLTIKKYLIAWLSKMASKLEGLRHSGIDFSPCSLSGRKWLPNWKGYDPTTYGIWNIPLPCRKWLPNWKGYDPILLASQPQTEMSKMASKLEGLRLQWVVIQTPIINVENGFQIGRVTTLHCQFLLFKRVCRKWLPNWKGYDLLG